MTSTELSGLLTAVRRSRVLTVTCGFRAPRSLLVRDISLRLSSNFFDGAAVVALEQLEQWEQLERSGQPEQSEHTTGMRELVAALGRVPGMPFLPCGTANAASWLAERDMLLVLDGTDRLSPEALGWLRALLARAPGLRILAAGRHPLAVGQGRVHRL
ncbi:MULTISPECIES: hypothetical protein [unclassified Streptomyces]|uniref:hypothetical protein n=1 Tax=unclassified Streptomyces TaxID=2593676 RepID=UPI001BEC9DB9|nr:MULTISPECIES: hypothetical protein [unclassified Streptomyces]MBT2403224.1 hypothetical protein [Streptomyces sp. ISL-21]MBT2454238.1 hypothetical protein [Streptomyces sp. ISL-86]MBT2610099.1 hypothetical protein [Streptomyces sp. ISL-87]